MWPVCVVVLTYYMIFDDVFFSCFLCQWRRPRGPSPPGVHYILLEAQQPVVAQANAFCQSCRDIDILLLCTWLSYINKRRMSEKEGGQQWSYFIYRSSLLSLFLCYLKAKGIHSPKATLSSFFIKKTILAFQNKLYYNIPYKFTLT